MPEDRIDVTVNAGNSFDVFQRLGVASDRLAAGGGRIGESFVRGERAVRVASQNISAALLSAGDATSTFLTVASGLERVFRIGIGPTIGIAAGIKAFELVHEEVKKTNDAYKDLKAEIERPISADSVTQDMDERIKLLTDKIKTLEDQAKKTTVTFSAMFALLSGTAAKLFLPQLISREITGGLAGLLPPGAGKLAELSKSGIDRIEALAEERGRKILAAADKLHEALVAAVERFRTSTGNLFRDIGTGQFFKDLQQRQADNTATQAGQDMVRQFEEDIANGIPIGPNAAAAVNAARAAAAKGGVGIQDILNADFSNLDILSKYDFSGLAPLANMTIIVQ